MADNRMQDDDRQRNMGNREDQDFGQQAPGRSGQGQGGQQGGSKQGGQIGGEKGAGNLDDDEDMDTGSSGGHNRGGQNR